MITVLLKKYNKALRFIFMKYANTGSIKSFKIKQLIIIIYYKGFSIIEVHS